MHNAIFSVPKAVNEPVKSYAPGSPERKALKAELERQLKETREVPMFIDGKEVRSDDKRDIRPPHDHKKVVGHYYQGGVSEVNQAINAAMKAKDAWANMAFEHRAAIFIKAAELLAGPYRASMNAATMINQSKKCLSGRDRRRL